MSKKIIIGTSDFHAEMRKAATNALRKLAGYIPPKIENPDDILELTWTAKPHRYGFADATHGIELKAEFSICGRCCYRARVLLRGDTPSAAFYLYGRHFQGEPCVCCGAIYDIPF